MFDIQSLGSRYLFSKGKQTINYVADKVSTYLEVEGHPKHHEIFYVQVPTHFTKKTSCIIYIE